MDKRLENITLTCAQRKKLFELHAEGYRYVTDNSEIPLFPLSFWSKKPRRSRIKEENGECYYVWGYQDEDVHKEGILMSLPAYKFDIEALHGKTKTHPILLLDLLRC